MGLPEIQNSHLYGIKVSDYYQSETFCGKEASKKYGNLTTEIKKSEAIKLKTDVNCRVHFSPQNYKETT